MHFLIYVVIFAVVSAELKAESPLRTLFTHENESKDAGFLKDAEDLARCRKAAAYTVQPKSAYGAAPHAPGRPSYAPAPAPSYSAPAPLTYPSPASSIPCSKSVVFSCAPVVSSAPCSAPSYTAPAY